MANEDYMCVGYDKKEMRRSTSFGKRNKHYRFTLRESYEEYYERVNKIKLGVYE